MATISNTNTLAPNSISRCVLWLDGADTSTVSLNGSNVSQWNDKSGNANNAAQATQANQPTYTSNALVFNGSSTRMTLATPSLLPSGSTVNGTFFFVTKTTSSATNVFFMYGPTTMVNGANPQFYYATNYYNIDTLGAGATNDSVNNILNTTALQTATLSNSGANTIVSGWRTGNAFSGGTTSTPTVSLTSQYATLGVSATTTVTNYQFYYAGNINEVIIYNRVLSTAERQQIEGYLVWKWGLQAQLPTSHPYYYNSTLPNLTLTKQINNPYIGSNSYILQPNAFAGCALWLDAADPSTVITNGSNVTQWNDKSPNGYNATQGTAINQPIIINKLNGLNTLNFNGSQYLTVSSSLDFGSGDVTCFIVANFATSTLQSAAVGCIISKNYPTNQYWQFGAINSGGPQCRFVMSSPFQSLTSVFAGGVLANGWDAIAYTLSLSGAQASSLFIHGASGATNTTFTSENTTSAATVYIGSTAGGGNSAWKSDIAEIIIYKSFLTATQRQQIEGYLTWKWGIQSSLPNTHPYYKNPAVPNAPFSVPITNPCFTIRSGLNPKNIPNLSLWLDSADVTTMTFSGTNVSQWNDKSGNGYNATLVLGSGATFTNTNSGLNFGEANCYATTLTASTNIESGFFVVNCANIAGNVGTIIGGSTSGSSTTGGRQFSISSTSAITINGGITSILGTSLVAPFNANNVVGLVGYVDNGTLTHYEFGSQIGTTAATTGSTFTASRITTIGGRGGATYTELMNGIIYEIVLFSSALTQNQQQQVEGYLAWKWGIQKNLPSTHPYYLFPPN